MTKDWRNSKTDQLFRAVLTMKNIMECEKFFRDLLTVQEIAEFSNRWKVVQMLDQKISYRKIQKETGVSTATITRISQWLNNGQGGYKLALDRTRPAATKISPEKEERKSPKIDKISPIKKFFNTNHQHSKNDTGMHRG